MNMWILVLFAGLRLSTPLIFASMGGLVSEKSGVINIALEGMLTVGAFFAVLGTYFTGNPWIGILLAVVSGGLVAAIHAFMSIRLGAQQTISGAAINTFAAAITSFLIYQVFKKGGQTDLVVSLPFAPATWFSGVPALGFVMQELNWFVLIALALVVFMKWFMDKSVLGLRICAVGEHPKAADTLGISVNRIRYGCVIGSGMLAGLGGAALSLSATPLFTEGMVAGRGFIALAAVVFGRWKPVNTFIACLIFGFADAIQILAQGFGWNMPSEFYAALPYLMSMTAMILFAGKAIAPKACGTAYVREHSK